MIGSVFMPPNLAHGMQVLKHRNHPPSSLQFRVKMVPMAARNRARRKRADCDDGDDVFSWKIRVGTYGDLKRSYEREFVPIHILLECASGYALFLAPGISKVEIDKFQSVEEFINSSPFQLVDAQRFSSHAEALSELNAISTSTLTHKLKDFLERNLPHPRKNYKLATSDSDLGLEIARKLLVPVTSGLVIYDVMRGFRDKIHTFLHLDLGALEKAQVTRARFYNNQGTTSPGLGSSSSYLQEQVVTVPHRCPSNQALRVHNEDRTEVEHPLRSKLGAAILRRFTNIWIKPGSRILYAGDVCALMVFNLSDLVGSDGLLYVVGFSGGNDVVHMAGKRENVVIIEGKYGYCHWHYRMLVGMVDVVFDEIDHCPNHPPGQQVFCEVVNFLVNNAPFYLRAGGHHIISRQVNNNSIGRGNDPFTEYNRRNEFTPIETLMLDGGYSLSVGGHRI